VQDCDCGPKFSIRFLTVKGEAEVLVREGKTISESMRRNKISHADLLEEARLNGMVDDLQLIRKATMERNGEISIITEK